MTNAVEEFLEHASYESVELGNIVENTSLDELVAAVLNRQDCILYGPPGTSKTHMIDELSTRLEDAGKLGEYQIVQFHANYSYEDFIEGIVPDVKEGGFRFAKGSFFEFCGKAKNVEKNDPEKICVFVIDEINRANVTSVFGEVLNLIENKGSRVISTPKQHLPFCIPQNVVIVGTMNTADKTLSKLDFAFRRRFRFLAVNPSKTILHEMISQKSFSSDFDITVDLYVDCFEIINTKIITHPLLGKNLALGHVLWTKKESGVYEKSDIGRIFRETIFPQIENYCGANKDVLGSLLGPALRDKIIYGYAISDDEIIDFLKGLANSKVRGE